MWVDEVVPRSQKLLNKKPQCQGWATSPRVISSQVHKPCPQITQAMAIAAHQNIVIRQRNQDGTGLEAFSLLYSLYGSERCRAGC